MKLRAPRGDREVLAEPGFATVPGLVQANRTALDHSDVRIAGMPLRELRALARREVVPSSDGPLVLAGHQPELSHPGVWVKNFALNGLARHIGGIALNLVVDNDTLKSTALRVPTWDTSPLAAHLQSVPFDRFTTEVPYESRMVQDSTLFASFAERVLPLTQAWGYEPLLAKAWPAIVAHPAATIGEKFASVRRWFEREWGYENRELPVSRLAETEAFACFASHILEDRQRFREVYNRCVQAYRDRHGIRSRSHPVPDLAPNEVPFWGEPGPDGRRGRVVGSPSPRTLRPRALTLTLFARVVLGDFFLHGIGGGIYDEVTDAIIRDYFSIDPPAFQVLSATLHLPLPALPATEADLAAAERTLRDLDWNPQRYLRPEQRTEAEIAQMVRWKEGLSANEPPYEEHAARRWRFQNLQEATRGLRPHVKDQRSAAAAKLETIREEVHANAVLQRRDFACVLYPEAMLREFCVEMGERYAAPSPSRNRR